jgi:phasin
MNDKPFEIPADMRVFAERSVEEAKAAFERYISAAQTAVSTFEDQAKATQTGVKDVRDKAVAFAEQNVTAAFDFAQQLVRARDPQEFSRLQTEFMKAQMQALTEQAKTMGEFMNRTVSDAMKKQP